MIRISKRFQQYLIKIQENKLKRHLKKQVYKHKRINKPRFSHNPKIENTLKNWKFIKIIDMTKKYSDIKYNIKPKIDKMIIYKQTKAIKDIYKQETLQSIYNTLGEKNKIHNLEINNLFINSPSQHISDINSINKIKLDITNKILTNKRHYEYTYYNKIHRIKHYDSIQQIYNDIHLDEYTKLYSNMLFEDPNQIILKQHKRYLEKINIKYKIKLDIKGIYHNIKTINKILKRINNQNYYNNLYMVLDLYMDIFNIKSLNFIKLCKTLKIDYYDFRNQFKYSEYNKSNPHSKMPFYKSKNDFIIKTTKRTKTHILKSNTKSITKPTKTHKLNPNYKPSLYSKAYNISKAKSKEINKKKHFNITPFNKAPKAYTKTNYNKLNIFNKFTIMLSKVKPYYIRIFRANYIDRINYIRSTKHLSYNNTNYPLTIYNSIFNNGIKIRGLRRNLNRFILTDPHKISCIKLLSPSHIIWNRNHIPNTNIYDYNSYNSSISFKANIHNPNKIENSMLTISTKLREFLNNNSLINTSNKSIINLEQYLLGKCYNIDHAFFNALYRAILLGGQKGLIPLDNKYVSFLIRFKFLFFTYKTKYIKNNYKVKSFYKNIQDNKDKLVDRIYKELLQYWDFSTNIKYHQYNNIAKLGDINGMYTNYQIKLNKDLQNNKIKLQDVTDNIINNINNNNNITLNNVTYYLNKESDLNNLIYLINKTISLKKKHNSDTLLNLREDFKLNSHKLDLELIYNKLEKYSNMYKKLLTLDDTNKLKLLKDYGANTSFKKWNLKDIYQYLEHMFNRYTTISRLNNITLLNLPHIPVNSSIVRVNDNKSSFLQLFYTYIKPYKGDMVILDASSSELWRLVDCSNSALYHMNKILKYNMTKSNCDGVINRSINLLENREIVKYESNLLNKLSRVRISKTYNDLKRYKLRPNKVHYYYTFKQDMNKVTKGTHLLPTKYKRINRLSINNLVYSPVLVTNPFNVILKYNTLNKGPNYKSALRHMKIEERLFLNRLVGNNYINKNSIDLLINDYSDPLLNTNRHLKKTLYKDLKVLISSMFNFYLRAEEFINSEELDMIRRKFVNLTKFEEKLVIEELLTGFDILTAKALDYPQIDQNYYDKLVRTNYIVGCYRKHISNSKQLHNDKRDALKISFDIIKSNIIDIKGFQFKNEYDIMFNLFLNLTNNIHNLGGYNTLYEVLCEVNGQVDDVLNELKLFNSIEEMATYCYKFNKLGLVTPPGLVKSGNIFYHLLFNNKFNNYHFKLFLENTEQPYNIDKIISLRKVLYENKVKLDTISIDKISRFPAVVDEFDDNNLRTLVLNRLVNKNYSSYEGLNDTLYNLIKLKLLSVSPMGYYKILNSYNYLASMYLNYVLYNDNMYNKLFLDYAKVVFIKEFAKLIKLSEPINYLSYPKISRELKYTFPLIKDLFSRTMIFKRGSLVKVLYGCNNSPDLPSIINDLFKNEVPTNIRHPNLVAYILNESKIINLKDAISNAYSQELYYHKCNGVDIATVLEDCYSSGNLLKDGQIENKQPYVYSAGLHNNSLLMDYNKEMEIIDSKVLDSNVVEDVDDVSSDINLYNVNYDSDLCLGLDLQLDSYDIDDILLKEFKLFRNDLKDIYNIDFTKFTFSKLNVYRRSHVAISTRLIELQECNLINVKLQDDKFNYLIPDNFEILNILYPDVAINMNAAHIAVTKDFRFLAKNHYNEIQDIIHKIKKSKSVFDSDTPLDTVEGPIIDVLKLYDMYRNKDLLNLPVADFIHVIQYLRKYQQSQNSAIEAHASATEVFNNLRLYRLLQEYKLINNKILNLNMARGQQNHNIKYKIK